MKKITEKEMIMAFLKEDKLYPPIGYEEAVEDLATGESVEVWDAIRDGWYNIRLGNVYQWYGLI